jgi:pimeloyl-ACP methyl ester carboxylesterase
MGAAGQPLVLIPGLLCDALLWRPQVSALADVAHCWVADHTRSDTMNGVAGDILRDIPFERFALAGLSMGGYIALEIMRQAAARVTRLALLDTSARPDTPEQTQRRLALVSLARRGRLRSVTRALLSLFVHPARLSDRELVTTVYQMAKNTGKDAFIREELAIVSRADSLPLLRSIGCPTLVLCGRQDAVTPVDRHDEIARAVEGSRLEIVENCGHLSTLERPREVALALRRWLGAETPPRRVGGADQDG